MLMTLGGATLLWDLSIPPHVAASEGIKQVIGVYVTNKNARVSISIQVGYSQDAGKMRVLLDVEGNATRAVVTSTVRDVRGEYHRVSLRSLPGPLYVQGYSLSSRPPVMPGEFSSIAEFDIQEGAISDVNGTYTARLPALAFDEVGQQVVPAFSATLAGSPSVRLYDVAQPKDYRKLGSTNPADYGLPDSATQELYWQPAHLSTSVTLENASSPLDDARIDAETPPNANFISGSLVWTSNAGIAPFVSATKWDAIESRSRWEFFSGLLFGIFAAALFAFLVELPDEFPMKIHLWKRQQGSPNTESAADAGPVAPPP
jgi:hypothetical protein